MDSREGKVAVYGNQALYKVDVVAVIPSLYRDSGRGNDRFGQKADKRKRKGGFDSLLKAEEEKNRQRDISISTYGYTKNAQSVKIMYQTHEYSE